MCHALLEAADIAPEYKNFYNLYTSRIILRYILFAGVGSHKSGD